MSKRYTGGFITKSPATPTGPLETGSAPGVWTLEQQMQYKKQGIWPLAGNVVIYVEDVFNTFLRVSDGTNTQVIVNDINLSANGGLVWSKPRAAAGENNIWVDSARGVNKYLISDLTAAQATMTYPYTFNTNGFTSGNGNFWGAGVSLVDWTFRKQPKFFDVVTYTGTGSAGQFVPHNLQANYGFAVIKRTDSTSDWWVLAKESSAASYWAINLNSTAAYTNLYGADPNLSTGFYPSSFNGGAYTNGATYVAYLFAATGSGGFGLAGTDSVVSCGTYIGTGTVGLAVTLGYEPQWVMIKRVFGVGNWTIFDNMRGMPVGSADTYLYANSSAAEASAELISPTATGFTIQSTVAGINTADDYYIYVAIRRGPMKVPTVGTSVFKANATSAAAGTVVTTNFPVDLEIGNFLDNYDNKPFTDRLRGYATSTSSRTGAPFLNSVNTLGDVTTGAPFSYNWGNKSVIIGNYISEYRQVSYYFGRAPSFFDIVAYTGTIAGGVLNHNLGVAPELMIFKSRASTGDNNWSVQCVSAPAGKVYSLNTTGFYNGTLATSLTASTVTLTDNTTNNTVAYVAYFFATCAGVSKVGSYTGNGTTQTINCGIAAGARFVLIKRTDAAGDWYVYDTARGMTTLTDPYLRLNTNEPEVATLGSVTTVATGFALNSAILAAINVNASTYIFLAIA